MGKTDGGRTLCWTVISLESWRLIAAASEEGLVYVACEAEPYTRFDKWRARHGPTWACVRDERRMQPYAEALQAYWNGEIRTFDMPFVSHGTEYQKRVWAELRKIDYGETVTYGEIARRIGQPEAVRAVGGAIGANPLLIVVPCHRVIGRAGTLTGYSGGLELKKRLLEIEGGLAKSGIAI